MLPKQALSAKMSGEEIKESQPILPATGGTRRNCRKLDLDSPKLLRGYQIPEILVCKGDSQKPSLPSSCLWLELRIPENQPLGKLSYQLWKKKYTYQFIIHLASSANLSISIGTELNGSEVQGKGDSGLVSMKNSCENNPVYLERGASGEIN